MLKPIVLGIAGCIHFNDNGRDICDATFVRLKLALTRASHNAGRDIFFICSGNSVKAIKDFFETEENTKLMKISKIPSENVIVSPVISSISAFSSIVSDAKKYVPECKKIIVFSSRWYFPLTKIAWMIYARISKLRVEVVRAKNQNYLSGGTS